MPSFHYIQSKETMTLSNEELISLSQKGFWPGPDETEFHFLRRVKLTRNELAPGAAEEEALRKTNATTQSLFDFSCEEIPFVYEDKGLSFWEGGALWVEEEQGMSLPHVQLKRNLRKGSYLMYKLEEVLSHEMLHAARIAYNEPRFEEILAYKTSKHPLRRYLGPLFRTSKEAGFFLVLLLIGFFLEMLSASGKIFVSAPWIAFPFLWLCVLYARARVAHRTFEKAQRKIQKILKDPMYSLAVLARLTDQEIKLFSKLPSDDIKRYVKEGQEKELRLAAIYQQYFA